MAPLLVRRASALAAVVALAFTPLPAQDPGEKKDTAEILGVAPSDRDAFRGAVKEKCKGKYCMATLKETLGYPESSVMMFEDGGLVVAVLDPARKDRLRYRDVPAKGGRLPASWEPLAALAAKEPMPFQAAVTGFATFKKDGADKAAAACPFGEEDGAKAKPFWTFFAAATDSRSLEVAAWTLANHAGTEARMLAAAILMNHADHELAWWSLAEGLRDANDRVKGTSQQALQYLTRECAREVDWGPAVPALRAVLDGTHLGAVPALSRTLLATKVDPALAAALLAGAGQGLLTYAPCARPQLGDPVRSLLSRLSGQDHRADAAKWKAWIDTLVAPAD